MQNYSNNVYKKDAKQIENSRRLTKSKTICKKKKIVCANARGIKSKTKSLKEIKYSIDCNIIGNIETNLKKRKVIYKDIDGLIKLER